ncbi:MAG: hypothetical protein AAFO95_15875 [Cyanobacteria bacterium J06600_6]
MQSDVLETGVGNGGDILVEAKSLSLNNNSLVSSANDPTAAREGTFTAGDLNLSIEDSLILSQNSQLSAFAGENTDGGNLTIDAGFVIAFPDGNNDIIANAEQGRGGNIDIDAQAVFGIVERPLGDLTNDINASSEVLGFEGGVNIETIDFNPLQGLIEIVSNIIEPQEQTAAQACESNREAAAQNGLNISGKGGVTPAPDLPLSSLNAYIDSQNTSSTTPAIPEAIATSQGKIQPARGVEITDAGVRLTAHRTGNFANRIPAIKSNCR